MAATLTLSQPAAAAVDIYGFGAARVGVVESTPSWLEGGFGRFDVGADDASSTDQFAELDVQVAADIDLGERFLIHAHVAGRTQNTSNDAEDLGLVEAFIRYQAIDSGSNALSFSLGQKFFSTSFENTDDLWQSPYTISWSAWNSWIAHEFRPIGLEMSYTHFLESGNRLGFRASVFGGNDSSGAELAWGGFRVSRRLSVLGEVLPLPPISTLQNGGSFAAQRDDGSKPFGPDLDDELGYAVQANFASETFKFKASYVDNNGDRELHRGEYAWETEFAIAGFEWDVSDEWKLLGEHATGSTAMGPANGGVDVDFDTTYLMASWARGNHRLSARIEQFEIEDVDGRPTNNAEDGDGWTLAYFYEPSSWRLGVEVSSIEVDRPAAFESGFDPDNDGNTVTLEFRYRF